MIKLRVFHEIHYFTLMVKIKDVKNRNYSVSMKIFRGQTILINFAAKFKFSL